MDVRQLLERILKRLGWQVYYVGGSEGLPPPLSRTETDECLDRLRRSDSSVKPVLIARNLRLVVYVAKRFENTGVGLEDLISIGTIGLIKAVDSFEGFFFCLPPVGRVSPIRREYVSVNSCAQHTVRPTKQERRSLEQKKVN